MERVVYFIKSRAYKENKIHLLPKGYYNLLVVGGTCHDGVSKLNCKYKYTTEEQRVILIGNMDSLTISLIKYFNCIEYFKEEAI